MTTLHRRFPALSLYTARRIFCTIALLQGAFTGAPHTVFAQLVHSDEANNSITLSPAIEPARQEKLQFVAHPVLSRARIGLAFSGGGARSLAQIGVLQVLLEHGFEVDCIVGTSMGSLIAGMFAAGYSPQEIERIAKEIDWRSILIDRPPRRNLFIGQKQNRDRLLFQIRFDGLKPQIPRAFTPGQKIQSLLTNLTMQSKFASESDFDQLRIPFRAICTDLYSGEKVVLARGDLAEAIRASLAVPLLFTGVPWQDKLLVDGGLMDNIPVGEVRKLGADIVIAVDASSGLREPSQLNAPWEIADQVTTIMQRDRNAKSRASADILISIDAGDRTNMDFTNLDSLIAMGRTGMAAHLPLLREKISRVQAQKHSDFVDTTLYITLFEAAGLASPAFVASTSNANGMGRPISTGQIMSYLENLVQQGIYADVSATLTPAEFGYICKINAKPNPVLNKVVFRGNTVFPSDTLRSDFAALLNKPLHRARSQYALDRIISRYRQSGYALARISDITFDAERGIGAVSIDEGVIRKIDIAGTRRTKKYVVSREFPQKSGDIFNFQDAQKGVDNIFGTGLFDRVSYALQSKSNGAELLLKLQEKKYTALGLSARIDSERKSQSLVEISDENLFGIGAKFALQGLYGSRDRGLRGKFSLERIFKTYLTFDAEAFYSRRQNLVYQLGEDDPIGEYIEKRLGANIGIGQLMERLGAVNIELQTDRFELSEVSGIGYGSGISIINRLTFRSILDTRDQLPYPTKGRYVHFFYDLSSKLFNQQLSKDVSFFRTYFSVETYHTIAKRHTLNPRFTMGTADLTTPFVMQFRLNGYEHIFGLRDQELIGRHFLLGNLTYRYRLPEVLPVAWHAGLRYDLWGMWENTEKAVYRELNNSFGVFVGLETFLGAIELAYGKANIGQKRFYFSIGHQF